MTAQLNRDAGKAQADSVAQGEHQRGKLPRLPAESRGDVDYLADIASELLLAAGTDVAAIRRIL